MKIVSVKHSCNFSKIPCLCFCVKRQILLNHNIFFTKESMLVYSHLIFHCDKYTNDLKRFLWGVCKNGPWRTNFAVNDETIKSALKIDVLFLLIKRCRESDFKVLILPYLDIFYMSSLTFQAKIQVPFCSKYIEQSNQ